MHVLILAYAYPNSFDRQSHSFIEAQAKTLAEAGLKVGVVSAVPISLKRVWKRKRVHFGMETRLEGGVAVYLYCFPALPFARRFNAALRTYFGKRLVRHYLKEQGRPDLLHVQISLVGNLALWALRALRLPYVVTEHYSSFLKDTVSRRQKRIVRKVFAAATENIAVSPALAEALTQTYGYTFKVIPNLVDTNFFMPASGVPLHSERCRFVSVGNLKPEKNHSMLIRAFATAFGKDSRYSLTIVGGGSLHGELAALISTLGLQKQVTLFGKADRNAVREQLRSADVFVLPSQYETFGVVLVEAMACGLPILSTRCGGPESIVTDTFLGKLCNNSESALSEALGAMCRHSFDCTGIREHAVTHYSAKYIAVKLTEVYRKATDMPNEKKGN